MLLIGVRVGQNWWGVVLHRIILCLLTVPFLVRFASSTLYPYLLLPMVSLSYSAKMVSCYDEPTLTESIFLSGRQGHPVLLYHLLQVPPKSGTVGIKFQHWSWGRAVADAQVNFTLSRIQCSTFTLCSQLAPLSIQSGYVAQNLGLEKCTMVNSLNQVSGAVVVTVLL